MILNPAIDSTNPFVVEVEKRLYEYFCKGVLLADGKKLALGGGIIVLTSPISILISMFRNWHKVLFLLFIWWFSIEYLELYKNASEGLLFFGLIAILWRPILDELQNISKGFLIFITWGYAIKFLCRTCINQNFFGQEILLKGNNEKIITSLAGILGGGFREKYDRLVDLYLQSNTDTGRDILKKFLENEKSEEKL